MGKLDDSRANGQNASSVQTSLHTSLTSSMHNSGGTDSDPRWNARATNVDARVDLAILCAMGVETDAICDQLGAPRPVRANEVWPVHVSEFQIESHRVLIIENGRDSRFGVDLVATQPATLTSTLVCERFAPAILLNAGTAGGFAARGGKVGEVCIGRDYIFHDRIIPLPGYADYGIGSYRGTEAGWLAQALGLRLASVSTGNSLQSTSAERDFFAARQVDLKEMEAAAIAWVASLYEIPFYSIKSISDLVDTDRPTAEQFEANLELATQRLAQAVARAVPPLIEAAWSTR